jgi:hypothetical protein
MPKNFVNLQNPFSCLYTPINQSIFPSLDPRTDKTIIGILFRMTVQLTFLLFPHLFRTSNDNNNRHLCRHCSVVACLWQTCDPANWILIFILYKMLAQKFTETFQFINTIKILSRLLLFLPSFIFSSSANNAVFHFPASGCEQYQHCPPSL